MLFNEADRFFTTSGNSCKGHTVIPFLHFSSEKKTQSVVFKQNKPEVKITKDKVVKD
jgi:hypothetical protein